MSIKALALLCLVSVGIEADRIRILSNNEQNAAARSAYKSRIRSLVLKSTLDRALDEQANNPPASPSSNQLSSKSLDSVSTLTSNPFDQKPSVKDYPTGPGAIPPGCYYIKPCQCCEHETTTSATTKSVSPFTGQTAKTKPGSRATSFATTYSPYALPSVPIDPYPQEPTTPAVPSTPKPGCHNSSIVPCFIPIMIPCYVCPCLSACSLVPIGSCPCGVDPSIEYTCPYEQPNRALLSELPAKINSGYRLMDQLRQAPICAYKQNFMQQPDQLHLPAAEFVQAPEQQTFPLGFKADDEQSHFGLFGAGQEGVAQPQSPNHFLFRQQRQRPLPSQYKPLPYAYPPYAQPVPNYPYPVVPGYASPKIPDYPTYVQPNSSTYETTTKSAASYTPTSLAIFGSLAMLLLTVCFI